MERSGAQRWRISDSRCPRCSGSCTCSINRLHPANAQVLQWLCFQRQDLWGSWGGGHICRPGARSGCWLLCQLQLADQNTHGWVEIRTHQSRNIGGTSYETPGVVSQTCRIIAGYCHDVVANLLQSCCSWGCVPYVSNCCADLDTILCRSCRIFAGKRTRPCCFCVSIVSAEKLYQCCNELVAYLLQLCRYSVSRFWHDGVVVIVR